MNYIQLNCIKLKDILISSINILRFNNSKISYLLYLNLRLWKK